MTRITVASLLNNSPAPTAPAANTASASTVPPGPLPRTTVANQTAPRAGMPPDPRGTPFGSRWLKEASNVQFMQQVTLRRASSTDLSRLAGFCEYLETNKPQASSGETVKNIAQFRALATPEIRRALVNDAIGRRLSQGSLQAAVRGPVEHWVASIGVQLRPRVQADPYSGLSTSERRVMRRVDALPNLASTDRARYKSFITLLPDLGPTLPGNTQPISHIDTFRRLPLHDQQTLLEGLDYERLLSVGMRVSVQRVQARLAAASHGGASAAEQARNDAT